MFVIKRNNTFFVHQQSKALSPHYNPLPPLENGGTGGGVKGNGLNIKFSFGYIHNYSSNLSIRGT